ncbi:uncharacterized protein LOC131624068 [Vicia villosa]|uniref:uncharacterized protein LOC131624068 n=1 Tax=Vicia villosa TaxID=3911 RepID=UPI00273BB9E8|nr:uncharacterized protein LOC131624068 [Vicia villosa]
MLKIDNDFLNNIKEAQKLDVKLVDIIVGGGKSERSDFKVETQGVLRLQDRICIPDDDNMKRMILEEAHRSNLSIHHGATKMYQDLKKIFWWPRMKEYVARIGMAPFEALYGQRCRTPLCWHESGEGVVLGPEIVRETTDKVKLIREKMRASQSRQKSYHDKRRKELEFESGDHVFLRVTPVTGVGRSLKSKKLTP